MSGWDKSPTLFIKTVEEDLAEKRNTVAAELLQTIIASSPVDEGTFKSNHRVTVDSVDLGYDLDAKEDSQIGVVEGTAVLARGLSAIDEAKGPYHSVTIQNNLPYAEALENGHSQQAPQGVYITSFNFIREKHGE